MLPYDQLMQELDVINVRELEDFLINECMYAVCILLSSIFLLQFVAFLYLLVVFTFYYTLLLCEDAGIFVLSLFLCVHKFLLGCKFSILQLLKGKAFIDSEYLSSNFKERVFKLL